MLTMLTFLFAAPGGSGGIPRGSLSRRPAPGVVIRNIGERYSRRPRGCYSQHWGTLFTPSPGLSPRATNRGPLTGSYWGLLMAVYAACIS
jgi:hypothetical protein